MIILEDLTFDCLSAKLDGSTTMHCISCKTRADNI